MSADRWAVELKVAELSDGISWRLSRPRSNSGEILYSFGSQRTAIARALTEQQVYDTLKITCHELVTVGRLPWLF